jgi:hypothetical protein
MSTFLRAPLFELPDSTSAAILVCHRAMRPE